MECHAETWTYTLAVLLVLTPKCIRNKALARARLLIKRCVERKCDKELSAPPLVTDEDTSDTLAAKGWDQKCFAEQHPVSVFRGCLGGRGGEGVELGIGGVEGGGSYFGYLSIDALFCLTFSLSHTTLASSLLTHLSTPTHLHPPLSLHYTIVSRLTIATHSSAATLSTRWASSPASRLFACLA